ncbi:ATP-binding protein [Nocardia alba]|uniref:Serine/threonine-protein kinase RsbW n=1 Tax=Nocardia alba TaxID=225051 RepID=A0A4R1F6X7_9NOCA|nr:ATP-binding protein [Nocardia alba]TCJ89733.1 serine/threonine-protein kinase RsbW [Nocardia alba]
MDSSNRIITDSTPATSTRVQVDADLGQVVMLRAVAETVALIAGFTMDEVADIRVALDEAATCLILDAIPESEIHCEVIADGFRIRVEVDAVCATTGPMDTTGFGWHVLNSITDHLTADHRAYSREQGGYPVTITFTQVRRVR